MFVCFFVGGGLNHHCKIKKIKNKIFLFSEPDDDDGSSEDTDTSEDDGDKAEDENADQNEEEDWRWHDSTIFYMDGCNAKTGKIVLICFINFSFTRILCDMYIKKKKASIFFSKISLIWNFLWEFPIW